MYLCLTETIKLNALYYFRRGRKAVVIHWRDYVVAEGLMLGVVLGNIKFLEPLQYQSIFKSIFLAAYLYGVVLCLIG